MLLNRVLSTICKQQVAKFIQAVVVLCFSLVGTYGSNIDFLIQGLIPKILKLP